MRAMIRLQSLVLALCGLTVALSAGGCRKDPVCGDGTVASPETCDDGNVAATDGCGASCLVEGGWTCAGEPSVCVETSGPVCGDGVVDASEACDDGNIEGADGCDGSCEVEAGWACAGEPSVCAQTVCGDGAVEGGEACDDGNTTAGDGCDDTCAIEAGFMCTGEPSVCTPIAAVCGDGLVGAGESCDDANTTAGDGCDDSCMIEPGFMCTGEPSVCTATTGPVCGDGVVDPSEGCDDGDLTAGDGCDAACTVEAGFTCVGEPSVCTATSVSCGDGVLDAGEACDDGNLTGGDGCSATCAFEATCGNTVVEPGETCDDGNTTAGDGCDATCLIEPGSACGDAVDLNDPANVTVAGTTTTYLGDTTGSPLVGFGLRSCGGGASVEAIVHRYTLAASGFLDIQTLDVGGALGDTVIYGYLDCQAADNDIFCDDDGDPLGGTYSLATTAVLPAGTTVYIVVTGFGGGDVGPYQLDVTETPAAVPVPSCSTTTPIGGAGTFMGDTTGLNDTESGSCVGGGLPEQIFELVMTNGFDIDVEAAPTDPSFDIGVYLRAGPCETGVEIDCADSAGDGGSDFIGATDLPAGTYYLVVDGFVPGDFGTFDLIVDIVDILAPGAACDPTDPTTRCQTGTTCSGPAGAETCPVITTILLETFDTSLGGFTASDTDMDGVGFTWCDDGGTCPFSNTTGSPSGGGFALADDPDDPTVFEESLTSPVLDGTGFTTVFLEFDHDYNNAFGPAEVGVVQVSTDGIVWTDVFTFDSIDVVAHEVFDISAFAAGQATFYVRFFFDDDTGGAMVTANEWRIDDVWVWGA